MSTDRVEWVEIIEPRTKEHMYANLTTGECVWDPPRGVPVKRTDDNQWWELYDQKSARFYYYNATSQKTVWHRPHNSDIIPLAKLQTLKQNTEVPEDEERARTRRESVATQTATKGLVRDAPVTSNPNRPRTSTIATQTSPGTSPKEKRKHHHHHHHHHHHSGKQRGPSPSTSFSAKEEDPTLRGIPSVQGQQQWGTQNKASARSGSDSSSVSHSRSSLDVNNQALVRRHDSCCSTESGGSSHSHRPVPPVVDGGRLRQQIDFHPHQNGGGHHLHDLRTSSSNEFNSNRQRSLEVDHHHGVSGIWRQASAETPVGVSRSSSMRMTGTVVDACTPRMTRKLSEVTAGAHDNLGYQDYQAVPVESSSIRYPPDGLCTPVTNRRQWARSSSRSTDSSMSSPQSPLVPNLQTARETDTSGFRPSRAQVVEDSSPLSLDTHPVDARDVNMLMDSYQRSGTSPGTRLGRSNSKCSSFDAPPTKVAHNREGSELGSYFHNSSFSESQKSNKNSNLPPQNSNDQPTPLYSGMDYPFFWDCKTDNQSYVLPLQHYLLEQAKLSGCRLGDFMGDDRDSLSQSDEDSDGHREEDDDFADDEGMSHQDSSSQYLDDSRFLDEDYDEGEDEEQAYCEPITPPPRHRSMPAKGTVLKIDDSLDYECVGNDDYCTSSPLLPPRNRPTAVPPQPQQVASGPATQHASLRRKRTTDDHSSNQPTLEKSQSFQPDMGQVPGHRPLSMMAASTTDSNVALNPVTGSLQRQTGGLVTNTLYKDKKPPSESDIEKYAQDNLNRHKKGIFRKKFTIQELLSWSKDPIRKPMITTTDKALKREACELFKLIQVFMGDRKPKGNQVGDPVALEIATRGWSKAALRDELFIQICRQTTDNPRRESLQLGWELLAICLAFFPPSVKFQPYLESYISRNVDTQLDTDELKISHYAAISHKRLERIGQSGAKKGLRKPTLEEIDQSRMQIFRPSMFGNTLDEVMALQKMRYPSAQLPWIQTTLSEAVLKLNGAQTEGIFRVPGDIDEVNAMKLRMDQWVEVEAIDPHVPASLLKLWYRELYEPLIPSCFYQECIDNCMEPTAAVQIVSKLPEINRLVLAYLVRFLQVFAAEANSLVTKMDANNLAMVMAPNCLRCMSDDPRIIFENTRKEMAFIRCLIQHLDTSFMEGIM